MMGVERRRTRHARAVLDLGSARKGAPDACHGLDARQDRPDHRGDRRHRQGGGHRAGRDGRPGGHHRPGPRTRRGGGRRDRPRVGRTGRGHLRRRHVVPGRGPAAGRRGPRRLPAAGRAAQQRRRVLEPSPHHGRRARAHVRAQPPRTVPADRASSWTGSRRARRPGSSRSRPVPSPWARSTSRI